MMPVLSCSSLKQNLGDLHFQNFFANVLKKGHQERRESRSLATPFRINKSNLSPKLSPAVPFDLPHRT
jgi:hypothetical protein